MPIASEGIPFVPGNGPQVVDEFADRIPLLPPMPLRVSMMRTGWNGPVPAVLSTRSVFERRYDPVELDNHSTPFISRASSN
jgi:hypothetical protein